MNSKDSQSAFAPQHIPTHQGELSGPCVGLSPFFSSKNVESIVWSFGLREV